jgi:hypothetical protein
MNSLAKAAEEFNQNTRRQDGAAVAGCLANGLAMLRTSLYVRLHHDVESAFGQDSMLMPISEAKTMELAAEHIEAYQIAESTAAVRQCGYIAEPGDWYLPWLATLRLGERGSVPEVLKRCTAYLSATPDGRRLAFTNISASVLPESRRAPLVLFRLLPLSIQIATAMAFGDHRTAADLRRQQSALLPAITSCQQCHGGVLECCEQCPVCGSPLWKYKWLVAID